MDEWARFSGLLRQLFHTTESELDHGIYRLLNRRRALLEDFINRVVPELVDTAVSSYVESRAARSRAKLNDKARDVLTQLGPLALRSDGELDPVFLSTPLGAEYAELRKLAQLGLAPGAISHQVYNELYVFFSRYYADGDFIPQPRFGKAPSYWVPQSGNEVALHWATRDQYFVRTYERFAPYRVKLEHGTMVLEVVRLEAATLSGKRFFVLNENALIWDKTTQVLRAGFDYRPLAEAEQRDLADATERNPQDALRNRASDRLIAFVAQKAGKSLATDLVAPDGPGTVLLRHLNRFTRGQQADYFVHRDLGGFLRRELDVFLKTQVVVTEELLSENDETRERQLLLARAVQAAATPVISFLAQIEDLQRDLFERRKLILRTHYCATLDQVPADLYAQILANKSQIEEWEQLFALSELRRGTQGRELPLNEEFLVSHARRLVVDSRHFSDDFKWRFLESKDDLDEQLDGVLIKADNFQALALLLNKYSGLIALTYIDPPFNTETDQFLYKDRFEDATWLTIMQNRLDLAKNFLRDDGSIYVHLDVNANYLGRFLLDDLFGADSLLNEIIWRIGWVSGYKVAADKFVRNHDTLFLYQRANAYFDKSSAQIPYLGFEEKTVQKELAAIAKKWAITGKYESIKLVFYGKDGTVYKIKNDEGSGRYNVEDTWNSNEYERLDSNKIKRNAAEYTPNGSLLTQKPEALLQRVIQTSSREGDYVLDFFAGSGTTPAVAKKLGRRYIAVEAGPYFETDMLWRLKKVISGHKVGISSKVKYAGGGFFKYHYLESYEDVLDKIELPRAGVGDELAKRLGTGYVTEELLNFEAGPTPGIDARSFVDPLNHRILTTEFGRAEAVTPDLVETFNYLLGLQVRRIRRFQNGAKDYVGVMGVKEGNSTAVIWRNVEDLGDEMRLKADAIFIERTVLPSLGATQAVRLLVNGPCVARAGSGAEAIDGEFARLLTSLVFSNG